MKAPALLVRYCSLAFLLVLGFSFSSCQKEDFNRLSAERAQHSDEVLDDWESEGSVDELAACKQATTAQLARVNQGASKRELFLNRCIAETSSTKWCSEIARPNPDSSNTFHCTYSTQQAHVFVHPEESTWSNAIEAVKIVMSLQNKGINVQTIYNWWRPEPYNANVGGAAGRHPFGTSVDVRFASKADQNSAFKELCRARKEGRIRAVGYYSGTGLHIGVGDKTANTWGKSCSI